MMAIYWRGCFFIAILSSCILLRSSHAHEGTCNKNANDVKSTNNNDGHDETSCQPNLEEESELKYEFPGCRLYLAPSTIQEKRGNQPESLPQLGIFTAIPLKRGQPVAPPDIIIHLTDYLAGLGLLLSSQSYNPLQFGAQYEARSVATILPGVASLAVPTFHKDANAVPFGRDVDEANVPRTKMPGAGAFTHYHNFTFYAKHDLEAGREIFIGLSEKDEERYGWYRDRIQHVKDWTKNEKELNSKKVEVKYLMEQGICIDNMMPAKSTIKGAARGAFATRFVPKGAIISATPLFAVDRNATMTKRVKYGGKIQKSSPQLLINYCFGHENSSLLFYPYSPVVNLINHGGDIGANVKVRWSKASISRLNNLTKRNDPDTLINENAGLLTIEYVATRDIQVKEEILLDYGSHWQNAWNQHTQNWEPLPNANAYTPSYVMDDVAALLRNEKEQTTHPYPPNVLTACFYKYSIHERNDGIAYEQSTSSSATIVKWTMDRQTFDYANLRPCSIMGREDPNGDGKHVLYTAMMKNYGGMRKEEIIPKGEMHIVDSIPRHAIRFVDKIYSTDVHLKDAFRHEIQIPDDMIHDSWLNLE